MLLPSSNLDPGLKIAGVTDEGMIEPFRNDGCGGVFPSFSPAPGGRECPDSLLNCFYQAILSGNYQDKMSSNCQILCPRIRKD